jgi:hypothetical protein
MVRGTVVTLPMNKEHILAIDSLVAQHFLNFVDLFIALLGIGRH